MTLLIGDPAVADIPVLECGEPLVGLEPDTAGVGLAVADGHRAASEQPAGIDGYTARLRAADPLLHGAAVDRLGSRHVAPLATAPHVAGAAVDLTPTVDGEPSDRYWAAVTGAPHAMYGPVDLPVAAGVPA